jgi:hypothetical protein
MLKRWLLPGALVVVLALLGLLAPWWWPRLLDLVDAHSDRIQALEGLVQMVLWLGAAAVAMIRLLLPRNPRAPELQARPSLVAHDGSQVAAATGSS